jgi:ATP-dependent DNA helicase DinG
MSAAETVATAGAPPTGPDTAGDRPRSAVDVLRALVAQRPGGEVRAQQEQMVTAVETAIRTSAHLVVQAGTGTGKSLGYLVPAIHSGQRVVISTATKQLGEQLVETDLPTLARLLPPLTGRTFTYALIKGRNNYLCQQRQHELVTLDEAAIEKVGEQEALFAADPPAARPTRPTSDDLLALNRLLKWADETETGDRSHAPAAPDRVWNEVSTDAAGCPGARSCPFGQTCFAEQARAVARESDVVVTNHAQVAQDLRSPAPMLGEYDVLITDEVHDLESYLSSAWGSEVAPAAMRTTLALAARKLPRSPAAEAARETAKKAADDLDALADLLTADEPGLKPALPADVAALLITIGQQVADVAMALDGAAAAAGDAHAPEVKGAAGKAREMYEALVTVASAGDGTVRWLEAARGKRPAVLKVAPLWVGPRLMELLAERTLIATSATVTVGGSFDAAVRTLALDQPRTIDGKQRPPRAFTTVDVGTPFDYDKQALLYLPDAAFPEPAGPQRARHTEAVLDEVTALVTAAGGRTLALFTTTAGAQRAAEHLRRQVSTPVLAQGDAPASQMIRQFTDDEASTLCATMGFWHGLDVPGPSCSLVIIDKVPFAPMDDPLMSARRQAADQAGRNGFTEVYVNQAAVMLAQGAGRLIRTGTDRGVVAILDLRLLSKGYGRTLLGSLPPMRQFRQREVVAAALTRLTGGPAPTSGSKPSATSPSATSASTPASTPITPVPKQRKAAPRKASTRALARTQQAPKPR